jgi:hypothetical protein
LEIEQSPSRAFFYTLLRNNYIFICIVGFLILFSIDSKTAFVMENIYFLILPVLILLFAVWLFLFNRNPRLPVYKVTFDNDRLTIERLTSTQNIEWNTIHSYQLGKWSHELIIKIKEKNFPARIDLYAFNKEQRDEIIKQMRSFHG